MNSRIFHGIGRGVSEVGIGTWQLGGAEWGDVSEAQAIETLHAAADNGTRVIDTADIYGLGRSESLIGKFLESRTDQDDFVVLSKFGRNPDPGWPENFTKETLVKHTEDSLKRLRVDSLDLTQSHCVPQEYLSDGQVWDTLRTLKQQGKIKAFGASVESVDEALECLNVDGLSSLQIIFNVFRQKPIEVLFEEAQKRNVAIIVRLPLASGLLSGRMSAATQFDSNDHRTFNEDGQQFNVGETFAGLGLGVGVEMVNHLKPFLPDDMTMAQWALRWCLDFPAVTAVIPGASKPEQARQNAQASDLSSIPQAVHAKLRNLYQSEFHHRIRGKY